MTDTKAMRPLLTLLLALAAAAAAASTPETAEEDWQWSEEPRNAHNYRQDFGKRISAAGKARKGAVEGYLIANPF